jgi:hypothetical protein
MAKLISFNVPVQDRKTKAITMEQKQGYVALLYVGNYQQKFVLQTNDIGEVKTLTHWASGMRVGDLDPIKVRYWTSYSRMTDREAANHLLVDACVRIGTDKVLATMNAAPVINGEG